MPKTGYVEWDLGRMMTEYIPTAKELHHAFLDACEECPQWTPFSGFQRELWHNKSIPVKNLHKKGLWKVLRYWNRNSTIGGKLINVTGYKVCLPEHILDFLDKTKKIIKDGGKDAFKTYVITNGGTL